MIRLLKQLVSNEKGQALPIVLCLLAIGGLAITANVSYCTTALKGSQIVREEMNGVYAAGAGVEHVLWSLKYSQPVSTNLTGNINGMTVNMTTDDMGPFTLVRGELQEVDETSHPDWLGVNGTMVQQGASYRYTITVTWQCPNEQSGKKPNLVEIGATLPTGYLYAANATITSENASPQDNISFSHSAFHQSTDNRSVWWVWDPPGQAPSIHKDNKILWLSFDLTGSGSEVDDYTWLKAQDQDIGTVGEIIGTRYKITATAKRSEDGRTTARIVADVMIETGGQMTIASWQIR